MKPLFVAHSETLTDGSVVWNVYMQPVDVLVFAAASEEQAKELATALNACVTQVLGE
jgi:hypothetical protein